MYAEVLPNVPRLTETYHYLIPPELEGLLQAGHLVEVSWGTQRVQGLVVTVESEPPPDIPEFKPIETLLDEQPVLSRSQLDLAYWIAYAYHAPLLDCALMMLPPGIAKQADNEYRLLDVNALANTETQQRVLDLLKERGALRGRQIERALPRRNWQAALQQLVRRKAVSRVPVLALPSVRPKQVKTVLLTLEPDEIPEALLQLRRSNRHAEILRYLVNLWPSQPELADLLHFTQAERRQVSALVKNGWIVLEKQGKVELARLAFSVAQTEAEIARLNKPSRKAQVLEFLAGEAGAAVEVSWVYAETGAVLADLQSLMERGWVSLDSFEFWRDPLEELEYVPASPPALTSGQQSAWERTAQALQQAQQSFQQRLGQPPRPILLHGVTGAGKTEIYLRAVSATLQAGRQAIVLVPEIALTPQTVRRFLARFPGKVAILHSELSEGERFDTWRRCRAGKVQVVVGARSALFAPLPQIGLIVVDEEHADAYRQDPPTSPFYNARDAAVKYARQLDALCILGSATPDVVSYSRARQGDYELLSLPRRVLAHHERVQRQSERLHVHSGFQHAPQEPENVLQNDLPQVSVVDMRQELRVGNTSMFSRTLQAALDETLARGEQAILFLNRRGRASYVFCRDCGHTLECPNCAIPFTYHSEFDRLVCHHCDTRRKPPVKCPQCGQLRIKYFGLGTERVLAAAQERWQSARFLRWDSDTTRVRGAHERILQLFSQQEADVLVGTQMIAKGLDLPLVTLVGVISADVGLSLPDFRASERAFQVLTQVSGRAGRSLLGGRVVLQTYQPEHYVIRAASQHDYSAFFEQESRYRRQQGYPPYGKVVRLLGEHSALAELEQSAQQLAQLLKQAIVAHKANSTQLSGPAPCFFEQRAGLYRWQLVLRGPNPARLLPASLPEHWVAEIDPLTLL